MYGIAKSHFIKWCSKNNNKFIYILVKFYLIPFSMMYGLYTDFFDHNEMHSFCQPGIFQGEKAGRCYYNNIVGEKLNMMAWDNRKEARIEGIKILCNIYNNKKS